MSDPSMPGILRWASAAAVWILVGSACRTFAAAPTWRWASSASERSPGGCHWVQSGATTLWEDWRGRGALDYPYTSAVAAEGITGESIEAGSVIAAIGSGG